MVSREGRVEPEGGVQRSHLQGETIRLSELRFEGDTICPQENPL